MDLNARPTRNFWDIFSCCQNISSGDEDENPANCATTDNYALTPVKLLGTKDMTNLSATDDLNTPTTCGTADFSFESYDSKLETIHEGNKIFDDDLSEVATEVTEQQSNDSEKESNFNEKGASVLYDKITSLVKEDDDDMPDMDSYLNDNGEAGASKEDTATQKRNPTEVSFYHFFVFMILRHIFGSSLLLRAYKNKKKSYWEKFLSLTNLTSNKNLTCKKDDDQLSKDSRRTMKLRQLKLDEGKCEVYPLLTDVSTIPEDETLP